MSEYGNVNLEKLRRSQLPEEPKPEPKEEEKVGVFRGEDLEPEQPVVSEPSVEETPKAAPEIEKLKETVDKQLKEFEKKIRAGEEKPQEVKEETALVKVVKEEKPEDKLGQARKKYVKAEKELEKRSGLFDEKLTGQALAKLRGKKSKAKVLEESRKAKEEYEKERGPLDSVERFLEERTKLVEEQMAVYAEKSKFNLIGRGYDAYKTLGQYNLKWGMEKLGLGAAAEKIEKHKGGKIIIRGLNARTVASFGLLGLGVVAGAGTAVGVGTILVRRAMAGAGTAVGTFDLLNLGADRASRKFLEKKAKQIEKYQEGSELWRHEAVGLLAKIESRAILDGKNIEDLKKDKIYNDLLEKYRKTAEAAVDYFKDMPEDDKLEAVAKRLEIENKYLDRRLKYQFENLKVDRLFIRKIGFSVVAGAAGMLVGSGEFAKLFGNKTEWQEGWSQFKSMFARPEVAEVVEPIDTTPGAGSGAVETPPAVRPPTPAVTETSPLRPEVGAAPPDTPTVPSGQVSEGVGEVKPPVQEITPSPQPSPQPSPEATAGTAEGVGVKVELRAGATYEVAADGEVILHAGKRGIEGAILDYAKEISGKDPEAYGRLLKSLGKYSPDVVNDPERLGKAVHRFILDYAKEHDFDPAKLDRILAADVRLKDILELDEDSVKYFEKATAAADVETSPVSPPHEEGFGEVAGRIAADSPEQYADVSEAVAAAVSDLTPTPVSETTAAELAEFANQKALKAGEVVRQVTGTAETGGVKLPEPPRPPTPESLTPHSASPTGAEELKEGGARTELPELPMSELEIYINDQFGLHPDEFQAVEGKSIGEFMHIFETGSSRFKALYGFLAEKLREIVEENQESNVIDPEVLNKVSLKEVVQDLAIKNYR